MKKEYKIIQLPFPLRFKEMDRSEAEYYYKWFQNQIQNRICELTHYIQSTSGFESWDSDYTPTSLDKLGVWLYEHVTTRERSKIEIENIYSKSPDWFRAIQIPDYDISFLTVSLSIDIAMYLSQVMQKNIAGLRWKMVTKPRSSDNYQQPVLYGKGKMVFNPVNIIITYAYGIARGSKGPERLRELYDIWANILVE
ncbi:MAG: hypothetical protein IT308_05015 [Anaerolineaceae bacterium]|nr:hypothetical protein [Anaerolineaceae bacterium]